MPFTSRQTSRAKVLFLLSAALSSALLLVGLAPASSPLWPRTEAPTQTLHFYFGNLHSHTAYSDGTGTPSEAYEYARNKAGLDFLAVTEHNHIKAEGTGDDPQGLHIADPDTPGLYGQFVDEADASNKDGEFVAIYGQEFSTMKNGGNHTNAFMARKRITTKNGDYVTVFSDQWMDDYDVAVIQFNHPWEAGVVPDSIGTKYDKNYGFNKFPTGKAFVNAVEGKVSLIEVINGPGTLKPKPGQIFASKRDARYYLKYLNMGLHLAPTADQDNHWRTWGTHTEARTVVLAPKLTRNEILKAMKERRVYATQDKDLRITFTVNGEVMGSRIDALSSGEEATIFVKVEDTDEVNSSYRISLYYDEGPKGGIAEVVDWQDVKNKESVTFKHEPQGGAGYYFVEVRSIKGGNKGLMAWTAPVWLE